MFNSWLREYTGLCLYDFRVLDLYGTSEKEVNELFQMWLDEVHPIPAEITKAMKAVADEGFDIRPF